MTIYYAHCLAIYNTPQEARDLAILKAIFPTEDIFNPNCKECETGYQNYGMPYFDNLIESEMDACAFRALPDGSIPAGIAKEIEAFQRQGKPVIELPSCMIRRTLSVEATREYLKEIGQRWE